MYSPIGYLALGIAQLFLASFNNGLRPSFAFGLSRIECEGKQMSYSILAGIMALFSLISLLTAASAFPDWYQQFQFERNSVLCDARIRDTDGPAPSRLGTLNVSFTYDVKGIPFEHSIPYMMGIHRPGQTLTIRYSSLHPDILQVKGREPVVTSPFLPLFFASMFGFLIRGALVRRKDYVFEEVNSQEEDSPEEPRTNAEKFPINAPIAPEIVRERHINNMDIELNSLPSEKSSYKTAKVQHHNE